MKFSEFTRLVKDLKKNHFYCLNAESEDEIYEYIKDKLAVRFAKENTVIPNMEVKFEKNKIDKITLDRAIKVKVSNEEIIISPLELQVAFKEAVLQSPKDIEDARHIRNIAKDHLNLASIEQYKEMLHGL